jgi:hypothetical protein
MMRRRRSLLWHGLLLVLKHPGAVLWTYALNLGLAVVFSLRLNAQLASILDRSLEAQRLNSAFDLGILAEVVHRITYQSPSTGGAGYVGLPLYLLLYFILVPGILFSYRAETPARLSILLSVGLQYFWRFVRITLLTLIVSSVVLIPLLIGQGLWSAHVAETQVGLSAILQNLAYTCMLLLVAALLRVYFDLVEVYVIQLGDRYLPNGRQDRRVRRTLLPAFRGLRENFGRIYGTFLLLTLFGFAAIAGASWLAANTLPHPRVLPTFLLIQSGLLAMLATRFWQRGAETILSCDYPLPPPSQPIHFSANSQPDAQSNPEPIVPSLDEPDPAVFHHDVPKTPTPCGDPGSPGAAAQPLTPPDNL